MKTKRVGLILLLEGLASTGIQMLVIRQVTGYVGASVLVTSIVVSLFLAALALGYFAGGRSTADYRDRLALNLVLSIGLFGIGLSYPVVDLFFSTMTDLTAHFSLVSHPLAHLFLYCLLVLVPLVFMLGQTVPLLLHTARASQSKSESAGNLTALSTVGNVIGCLVTALVLMVAFGVGTTIVINAVVLLIALISVMDLRSVKHLAGAAAAAVFIGVAVVLNIIIERQVFDATSVYANIKVQPHEDGRALVVNRQFASYTDDEGRAWPYIETMRDALRNRAKSEVLVLGAGGFTLSADETLTKHAFTYVDIDPELKDIAEQRFLGNAITGTYIAEDARSYLLTRKELVDVVVVDLFSSSVMIPAHTATLEFFELVESRLKPEGLALLNIAANPMLDDPYSRRIDTTVRAAFDRCVTDLSGFRDGLENLVYFCRSKIENRVAVLPYRDEYEGVSIDAFLLAQQQRKEP